MTRLRTLAFAIPVALAVAGLSGCAGRVERPVADGDLLVDPRMFEETDLPASALMELQAMEFHRASPDARRYPIFQRSRLLAHGGFSARFGAKSGARVRYFFDEKGRLLRTEKMYPPY